MKLRTVERHCTYHADWDLNSVIARCEGKIPPNKIGKTIYRLVTKNVPPKRVAGALVLIFKLQ
jgi:hypothetical protein